MNYNNLYRFLSIIFVITMLCISSVFPAENYKKVKVFVNSKQDLLKISSLEVDHSFRNPDGSIEFFLSDYDYKALQNSNLQFVVLIDNWDKYYTETRLADNVQQKELSKLRDTFIPKNFKYGSMGGYYTLEEVYENLDSMFADYPSLVSQRDSIGHTNEGRAIYAVKISNHPNSDEDEPEVLYTALHHAREPESMMQMIYYMYYLLENYGTDAEVTYLVDNREMYFIPVVNPDGYKYNQTTNPNGGGMWRKNRLNHNNGSFGVDLNRNYGPYQYWNSPNGGSSTDKYSDTYRGIEPFSEPETQAIRDFLYSHQIKTCLNYHTYSNLLIYPYGALGKETPDSSIFREFAEDMTQFNRYEFGTDIQTVGYTTRGNSDDYMYDGDPDLIGKIFAMTPEVGSEGFWPQQSRIIPLAEENLFPNLYYAWVAGGYTAISKTSFDKEYYNPGDTVFISVTFQNKGLATSGEFTGMLKSDPDYTKIINSEVSGSSLDSGAELFFERVFSFVIDNQTKIQSVIDFSLETYSGNMKMYSKNYQLTIGTPTVYISGIINNFGDNWTVVSNGTKKWELTEASYFSAPDCITDSKTGNYVSSTKVEAKLNSPIDLKGVLKPFLSFKTRFEIEKGWDYGQCLISADNGVSWKAFTGKFTSAGVSPFQPVGQPVYSGSQREWISEEIDLSEFADEQILIKFVLHTDEAVEMDGWYIDDVQIYHYPELSTDLNNEKTTPKNYLLSQNYPNPFNPVSNIKYEIGKTENVNLTVYDIMGNQVKTLVNELQSPGTYEVQFNGSDLASGIYIYRIRTGQFSETRAMVLIK